MIQWQHARKADGRPFVCFETFEVLDGRTVVGLIQCKGPCGGMGASRPHTHGPWIGFVGPDSDKAKNLAGTFPTQKIAATAVAAAAREAL